MKNDNWLTVDRKGFAQLIEHRGKGWMICELIQNAWDQDVTHVDVRIDEDAGRSPADRGFIISVTDDDPNGWADISHAYTMFAPSAKKSDPTKRGRFNLGEKMVLALAQWAEIRTVNSAIRFDDDGRGDLPTEERRERGSEFRARFDLSMDDLIEIKTTLQSMLPPKGIRTVWGIYGSMRDRRLPDPHPVEMEHRCATTSFQVSLPTLIEGDGGKMKPTTRKTGVDLYEPDHGEQPMIYEMGIPVVELGADDRWHIDVGQKVPLNMDRDNVTPGYLRSLRVAVLNNAHDLLSDDDAKTTWVTAASEDSRCTDEATETVMDHRFGAKRVAYDPSDREANNIATSKGYAVVHGGALTKGQWANVKSNAALPPAGQVTPSASVKHGDGDQNVISDEKQTEDQKATVALAGAMAVALIGHEIQVRVVLDKSNISKNAWYGGRSLTFNLQSLGHKFFAPTNLERQLDLILHELGHEYASNHLSDDYYHALTSLGAKLAVALVQDGSTLRRAMRKIERQLSNQLVTS